MKRRIMLVDDEPVILEITRWAFEAQGYEVFTASTGEEAFESYQACHPDVLLVDYKLTGMTGIELLRGIKAIDPEVCAIMITGLTHQSEAIEAECRQLGAFAFLRKPLRTEQVLEIVNEAMKQAKPKTKGTTA